MRRGMFPPSLALDTHASFGGQARSLALDTHASLGEAGPVRIEMRNTVVMSFFWALLLNTSAADAQDAGNVGLTITYPAGTGLQWHITDRVALRPAVTFAHSWTRSEPEPAGAGFSDSDDESDYLTFELSAPISVWKRDSLRMYAAPGYAYSRFSTHLHVEFSGPGIPEDSGDDVVFETTTHGFRGMLGLQYALHERFSVFAETGLRFDRSTDNQGSTAIEKSIGNTSAIGAIFYFRKR